MEFGVEIGEYRGVVRVPRRVFQRLLPETPIPERCVEAYYLHRSRFERIVERRRQRQLTEGRDRGDRGILSQRALGSSRKSWTSSKSCRRLFSQTTKWVPSPIVTERL